MFDLKLNIESNKLLMILSSRNVGAQLNDNKLKINSINQIINL